MKREPLAKVTRGRGRDGVVYLMIGDIPCGEAYGPLDILGLIEGRDQINAFIEKWAEERERPLVEALELIRNWEFNIMGDCVEDARTIARKAIEDFKMGKGEL